MLFRERFGTYSDNHTVHVGAVCAENAEVFYFIARVTYRNYCALES
jgi:hypothetical protein